MAKIKTDSSGQIIAQSKAPDSRPILEEIARMQPEFAKVLGGIMSPERMVRVACTAMRLSPELMQCSKASVLGALMTAAQLGLEPNTPAGLCYLIPRFNRDRGWECTIQLGYQGFIEIARRCGAAVYAHLVRNGDKFDMELGLSRKLTHVPGEDSDAPVLGAYAVAKFRDGSEPAFVFLTKREIDKRMDFALGKGRRGGFSPWTSHYEEMALKTAVRALWRWMPKTPIMLDAVSADEIPESQEIGAQDALVAEPVAEPVAEKEPAYDRETAADEEWMMATEGEGGAA